LAWVRTLRGRIARSSTRNIIIIIIIIIIMGHD
jgi:hypothetical protein